MISPVRPIVYLDHCATTPLDPEIAKLMREVDEQFPGNPSSIHAAGRQARARLEEARFALADCLRTGPDSVVFTGSGSEANNLAIHGTLAQRAGRPSHVIVSAIEHHSVLHAARALAARHDWISVSELRPRATGRINPTDVAAALTPDTCLICLMLVNNETGIIQPVPEIAGLAHSCQALLHCDAVQALGRLPLDMASLGADTLALAAHKVRGPRGVGALIAPSRLKLAPLVHGGTQEAYRRAGTENLAGAAGMAEAARRAIQAMTETAQCLRLLEESFLASLRQALARGGPPFQINGSVADKVPGVLNLAFRGIRNADLVVGMDLAGFAISAGSACSSGVVESSHVLQGMGLEPWQIDGGIRISFGRENTPREATLAAGQLADLARKLASDRTAT